MTVQDTPASSTFRQTIQLATQVLVGVLLAGTGYLLSTTTSNKTSIAVLDKTKMSHEDGVNLIREHTRAGEHPLAASDDDLKAAVSNIEKQQAIRDDNVRRELTEIKGSMQRLEEAFREKQ